MTDAFDAVTNNLRGQLSFSHFQVPFQLERNPTKLTII